MRSREPLRRAFYEAWTTRASDQGPNAGRWDNSAVMEEILRAPPRGRAPAGFQQLRRLRPRHAHGAQRRGGAQVPARAGRHGARRGAGGVRRTGGLRRTQARRLGRRLLRRAAAARALLGLAGGAAPLLPAAARARRAVRGRRAALRRAHPGARRAPRCGTRTRVCSTSQTPRGRAGRQLLPGRLRAAPQAQRRLDGRVRRAQAPRERGGAAGGLPGVQLPAARAGAPGTAHARRRADAVPRVRPRPASPADARGLPEHRRHQRRRLGCGRAAEPVPGELRLAPGGAAAHLRPLRERRAAAGRSSRRA